MLKRVLTGAGLVAVVTGFFFLRKLSASYFEILIWLFAVLGAFEIARAMGGRITSLQKCVAVIISALFAPAFYIAGFKGAAAVCAIGIAAQFIIFIFSFEKTSIENFGCALIAMFYPSVFLVFMSAANCLPAYSAAALVSVFAICSLTDTFAFFTGITFKGRKLCPAISPLKTVSGAIGGLLGGVIGALLVYFLLGGWLGKAVPAIWILIIAGLLGGVINQLGDLAESAVKRKLGLKDMGNLLPGHGGMMDRIDGIVFTAPILYLLFAFI